MTNHTHTITVTITLSNGAIVSASEDIRSLTDDAVTITAGNLGYGLIEAAYGELGDDA
jgi:uncharacterized protein (DUF111 family)